MTTSQGAPGPRRAGGGRKERLGVPEGNAARDTWISDFWLQRWERTNVYCFKHPVCGALLWWPRDTDTAALSAWGVSVASPHKAIVRLQ